MPPPPAVDPLTRYLFENPWPIGGLLIGVGLVLAWIGLRDGRADRVRMGCFALIPGAAVFILSSVVETSGERGRTLARELVESVATGDLTGVMGGFAPDATLHVGSPTNPGQSREVIRMATTWFLDRYTVTGHRISRLRGYSESRDAATVHLVVWTEVSGTPSGVSQWVLHVERRDAEWLITRMTFVSLNGQPPPMPVGFR